MLKTVFMFSGQGSHYYQMGRALYAQPGVFRSQMDYLGGIVRELCGCSIVDELYDPRRGKADLLDRTILTHPGIFIVEIALAKALIEKGLEPDIVLGASLGSFAAAALAGCISVEDALEALVRHAQALEERCPRGAMIAVLGDRRLCAESVFQPHCELAAVNFASHFVMAVRGDCLDRTEAELRRRQLTFQRLPVSFAFHSRWIDASREGLESALARATIRLARIPIACCAQADIVTVVSARHFWSACRDPILFHKTILMLERSEAHRYVDVGPAGTCASFLKYALPTESASRVRETLTPFGRDLANIASITAGAAQ
ncbi:MAG: acyltransferase domain-containing protein [Steroidobacteraceae bacterium]